MTATILRDIIQRIKTTPTLRSINREVGQIDYPEDFTIPVLPCVLVGFEGIDWNDGLSSRHFQSGTNNIILHVMSSCPTIINFMTAEKIEFSHDNLVDNIHEKVRDFLVRSGRQTNRIVKYEGGLVQVTSVPYFVDIEDIEVINTIPKPEPKITVQ